MDSPELERHYCQHTKTERKIIVHLIDEDCFLSFIFLEISLGLCHESDEFDVDNFLKSLGCKIVFLKVKMAHSRKSEKLDISENLPHFIVTLFFVNA